MRKFGNCLTSMFYEVKRQFPLFNQVEKGLCDVKKELNCGEKKKYNNIKSK